MRQYWWKILGIVILIYVVVMGLMTPLKPGIERVNTFNVTKTGNIRMDVSGYNTHFAEATENRAWLKLDSAHYIQSLKSTSTNNNKVSFDFAIPLVFPSPDSIQSFVLILDNEIDDPAVLPDAYFYNTNKREIDSLSMPANWEKGRIEGIDTNGKFQFPYRNLLKETIRNTFFHVALWFAMFILLIASVVYSIRYLIGHNYDHDIISSSLTKVAILFGVLGLITGSIWARFTWGTWWTTDVKLNMSAVSMLIYLAYLILRSSISDQDNRARTSAAYNIFAFCALIPLIFVIPRMTDSLHPGNGGNPALGGEDLENSLRMVFYPAIIGLTLIGLWIASLMIRYERVKDRWFTNQ